MRRTFGVASPATSIELEPNAHQGILITKPTPTFIRGVATAENVIAYSNAQETASVQSVTQTAPIEVTVFAMRAI